MNGIAGRVALVTGAAQGLGAEIARVLAADGAKVGVLDLEVDRTADTVDSIRTHGGEAIGLGADVGDVVAVEDAVARLVGQFGGLHIVVNNAGVTRDNLLFRMTEDDWDVVIRVHLRGAFARHPGRAETHGRRPARTDHQPVLDVGTRQPGPGQLLGRQGRPAGLHQDARDRARAVRHHRQLRSRRATSTPR